jgi:RNA polymerase subunit RPABC4/transcription elongation factor Spt4
MQDKELDALKRAGKVFDESGPSRKRCPSCSHFIYFQAGKCPVCGQAFPRTRKSGNLVLEVPEDDQKRKLAKLLLLGHTSASQAIQMLYVAELLLEAAGSWDEARRVVRETGEHRSSKSEAV